MASKVEVDELAGAGSAGVMTVVGEGGSTTTSLQQGLAKMWIQFNGESTISTQDSFNRGGLTDDGTGLYTVTFTNNMSNDDFAAPTGFNAVGAQFYAASTSSVQLRSTNSGGSAVDVTIVSAAVFGDLA